MAYITYSDIEKLLNITLSSNGQVLVNDLIPAVEAYVESYTGRDWQHSGSSDITETFDGGTDSFFPQFTPVASITSITVDGSVLNSPDIYNYGSYIKIATPALNKPRNVIIVYRTSATSLPNDLKHAIVRWVAEIFRSQDDAGKTASRVQTGPVSVDYIVQDGIPKFVELVLNRYQLHKIY